MKRFVEKVIPMLTVGAMLLTPSAAFAAQAPTDTTPVLAASSRSVDLPIRLLSYSMSATHFSGSFDLDYSSYDNVSNVRVRSATATVRQWKAATNEYVNVGVFEGTQSDPTNFDFNVNLSPGDKLFITCDIYAHLYDWDAYPFETVESSSSFTFQWQ